MGTREASERGFGGLRGASVMESQVVWEGFAGALESWSSGASRGMSPVAGG